MNVEKENRRSTEELFIAGKQEGVDCFGEYGVVFE